jgi:hypothetical protein
MTFQLLDSTFKVRASDIDKEQQIFLDLDAGIFFILV